MNTARNDECVYIPYPVDDLRHVASGRRPRLVKKNQPYIQAPDPELEQQARERMSETAVVLTDAQRDIVEQTIREHCRIRSWPLHAINVRSNHIHLVVTAERSGREVMKQLKAWCSRRLSDAEGLENSVAAGAGRRRWFTEGGRMKSVQDDTYFEIAVRYVSERQ